MAVSLPVSPNLLCNQKSPNIDAYWGLQVTVSFGRLGGIQ